MEYTENLNTILRLAKQEAERLNNTEIKPEHALLAIIRHGQGLAYQYLVQSGVNAEDVKIALDKRLMQNETPNTTFPMARSTQRALRLAKIEAEKYNNDTIGTIHLLLAMLRERVNMVAMFLQEQYGITYESIEKLYPKPAVPAESKDQEEDDEEDEMDNMDMMAQFAGNFLSPNRKKPSGKQSSSATPTLDKYGRDLTQMAKDGKLDPIYGREQEIERVIHILSRRKKNNPILIGEPGVGKSAIVEGIAMRIQEGNDPILAERRIIALEMASIVAGTSYRGQFEQRMKDVIKELRKNPQIILFIDEIHTLIGAGNAQGSLDAANILKPALARGEIQCIGATTTTEYRKTIEKDGALERRFQKVMVIAPQSEGTYQILVKVKPQYEAFHHVTYSEEALRACVSLTDRYITDRSQPDKAIDAMDEAGANHWLKTEIGAEDIARVVSQMSGIPIERVAQGEKEQLQQMDTILAQRVIGQNQAIEKVVKAIRRSRLGLRDPNRPIGTFFFLGSTGVGKTHLAQCLAEELFGSRDALIRFDMSEYMEKHTVSLLVGAPPGYIAHEDGGKLTEAVRRRPYSIILFDEIEKAHPDIFNILLQVLDEGRMTDRQGRLIDFRNTIIILTSNVGTRQLSEFGAGIGFDKGEMTQDIAEKSLTNALRKTFPPEFVNRIDDIITFAPLDKESLRKILDIELSKLIDRLQVTGHHLHVSEEAKEQLLAKAYEPKYGARPIKRAIQTWLEDIITDQLLQHPDQQLITIDTL